MTRKITITLAIVFAGLCFAAAGLSSHAQQRKDETRNQSRWQYSDDGLKRTVEIRGDAEFTDDFKDIRDVSAGGYVKIEEERDSDSRRYEVRRDRAG